MFQIKVFLELTHKHPKSDTMCHVHEVSVHPDTQLTKELFFL